MNDDQPCSAADDQTSVDAAVRTRDALIGRKARRYRFWSAAADFVLSIPAAVGIRIGG